MRNYDALVKAAEDGHLHVITELLPVEGATARIADALLKAAGNGHLHVVRGLLPVEGATARIADAFVSAACNGHLDVVRELLPVDGAKARIADALIYAAWNGHLDVVRELLTVECVKARIAQALVIAARKGHLHVVRELLPIAMNHNGIVRSVDTDLYLAVNINNVQSVQCLLEIKKAQALSANYANLNPSLNSFIGERLRDSIWHGDGRLAIKYMFAKFRWPDRRQVDDAAVAKVLNDISNVRREYIKCYEGAYPLFNELPSGVKAIIGAFIGKSKNIADYSNEDEAFLTLLCADKKQMLFARQAMNYVKAKKLRETASQETAKWEQETASQETANQETASQETANQETANQETANQETANQETANQETASQETANQETANQETASQETAKWEQETAVGYLPAFAFDRRSTTTLASLAVTLAAAAAGVYVAKSYARRQPI